MATVPPILGNLSPNQPDPNQQIAAPEFNPLVQDQTQPIGDNYENLAKNLQNKLWYMLMQQERQDEIPRRNEICEILRRKLYYRDEQYWWYSADTCQWNPPSVAPEGQEEDEGQSPAFQHVTNIIRSFAESLQSVLSQNNTAARFWPESPSDKNDIATAEQADTIIDLIHRKNDWQNRVDEMTYYMCTDGFLGGFVRYVSDAEKYGTDDMPVFGLQEVQTGPASTLCPACQNQYEGTTDTQPICPDCGSEMQDVPPPTAQVPQHLGTISVPKGQECITIVPALNLKRTMWADCQSEFLYLEWIYDMHKAKAMSMFPWVADQINASAGSYGDGGTANSYERIARRLLYLGTGRHTGMVLEDLGVIRRSWIRPCVFELERDTATREIFKQLYPKGCYVTFYNDVYCESRSESMDEKWETMQTCDGEGQVRPTLISSIMPVQDQLNDSVNLLFEQNMNGVPEAFGDQNVIDFDARDQQTASVGNMTPVDLPGNGDIRSKILFSPAVEPSQALTNYIQQLFSEIPQFLTGAFPALFGGNTGANDTASGIAIQRNQALGRIGRSWRRLQTFCANLDGKAVNCFKENNTQDVEVPKQNEAGGYQSEFISIDDLQGNVIAYPEVDAQYPTLQADIRGMLSSWFSGGNPMFLSWMQDPENQEYFLREMGASDIMAPGEEQRKRTYRIIQKLLQDKPTQAPNIPAQPPSPMSPQGTPEQPGPMIPSINPDPLIDDLGVALATCKSFMISDQGEEAEQSDPMGFANVHAYANACDQLQKQQAFHQAVVTQAIAGNGPAADLGGSEHISAPPSNNPREPQPSSPEAPGPSDSSA